MQFWPGALASDPLSRIRIPIELEWIWLARISWLRASPKPRQHYLNCYATAKKKTPKDDHRACAIGSKAEVVARDPTRVQGATRIDVDCLTHTSEDVALGNIVDPVAIGTDDRTTTGVAPVQADPATEIDAGRALAVEPEVVALHPCGGNGMDADAHGRVISGERQAANGGRLGRIEDLEQEVCRARDQHAHVGWCVRARTDIVWGRSVPRLGRAVEQDRLGRRRQAGREGDRAHPARRALPGRNGEVDRINAGNGVGVEDGLAQAARTRVSARRHCEGCGRQRRGRCGNDENGGKHTHVDGDAAACDASSVPLHEIPL